MPPVNTSFRSLCSRNCFNTRTKCGRIENRVLKFFIKLATLTAQFMLKLMSTRIWLSLSQTFIIGTFATKNIKFHPTSRNLQSWSLTEALSSTLMPEGSAMSLSISAFSRICKGDSLKVPITTRSMSLQKKQILNV